VKCWSLSAEVAGLKDLLSLVILQPALDVRWILSEALLREIKKNNQPMAAVLIQQAYCGRCRVPTCG
jgi:hypothetical protein